MSTPTHSRWRLLSRATPLFGLSLLALTGFAAWRQLRVLSPGDIRGALAAVSPAQWTLCLLLCAVSYLALAGYEWLAARHIGHTLPALRVLGIGAISWAISNTLGPAWLSGSAVRMRLYGREGLGTLDVAKIVAFGMLTFWSSFVVLAAGAVAIDPPDALGPSSRWIAAAVLGLAVLLVAISARVGKLRIGALHIALPTPSVIAAQLLVGLADNLAAIGALYVLLPASQPLSFPEVVSLFALSNLGGLLSGLPGGLGTLDGSLVALASPAVGSAAIVAAMIAWRVLYGLVPLLLALSALAAIEIAGVVRARPAWLGQEPLALSPALRAAGIALSAVAAVVLGWGLRPKTAVPDVPSDEDLSDAVRIAREAGVPNGWLAATGDKALLFDETRRAFLMFAVAGDTWVSYAGPIGDPGCLQSLLEDFRARATQAGARIALYQISCALVPLCADLGLRSYKLGEEARVPLRDFTLAGRAHKSRRSTVTRAQREGSSFEIIVAECVPAIASELAQVSSAWLREKGGREKGFSLGRFDERYLSRTPVAVVRREGVILAFANVLAAGQELSVELTKLAPEPPRMHSVARSLDLMRVRPDAPNGTMDYLFLSLLCWGNTEGYAHFNLGMAPLSGLPEGTHAPAWAKLGRFVYEKDFGPSRRSSTPDWEPRYLATESGWSLPPTLRALLVLVSGGLRASLGDHVKARG